MIRELDTILAREKTVTFLFAAHDELHNNAEALKEFLDGHGEKIEGGITDTLK